MTSQNSPRSEERPAAGGSIIAAVRARPRLLRMSRAEAIRAAIRAHVVR